MPFSRVHSLGFGRSLRLRAELSVGLDHEVKCHSVRACVFSPHFYIIQNHVKMQENQAAQQVLVVLVVLNECPNGEHYFFMDFYFVIDRTVRYITQTYCADFSPSYFQAIVSKNKDVGDVCLSSFVANTVDNSPNMDVATEKLHILKYKASHTSSTRQHRRTIHSHSFKMAAQNQCHQ